MVPLGMEEYLRVLTQKKGEYLPLLEAIKEVLVNPRWSRERVDRRIIWTVLSVSAAEKFLTQLVMGRRERATPAASPPPFPFSLYSLPSLLIPFLPFLRPSLLLQVRKLGVTGSSPTAPFPLVFSTCASLFAFVFSPSVYSSVSLLSHLHSLPTFLLVPPSIPPFFLSLRYSGSGIGS